jgi:hypothetical protein
VVWCARNPAWVGAWMFDFWAVVVRRAFIVAMNSFAKGGGDGDTSIILWVGFISFSFV